MKASEIALILMPAIILNVNSSIMWNKISNPKLHNKSNSAVSECKMHNGSIVIFGILTLRFWANSM